MSVVFDPVQSLFVACDVAAARHATAAQLQARRDGRLASLLRCAATRSPLYSRLMGKGGAQAPLAEWPMLRKAELMARFDDWTTDRALRLDTLRDFVADPARIAEAWLGRYVVWESSGSSGEPAIFVQDGAAMAVYDALEALRRTEPRPALRWLNPFFLGERYAFIGATGGHFAATVSIERLRRANPLLADAVHQVSFLLPPAEQARQLEAIQPTVIASYPSAAMLLAELRLAGRLRVSPREIRTGGETLTPAMRERIVQGFGCPVIDAYGASEFFTMASECRCGRLHLNSDWLVLEPVDAAGRLVAPGEPAARVLLTNLANHVQPLIRYDLGDRVLVDPRACECGSPLPVIQVAGRSDDVLTIGRPGETAVELLPLALCTVLEDEARLFDFQLCQTAPCELQLHTRLGGAAADDALRRASQALGRFLLAQGAGRCAIRTASGRAYETSPGGKASRVLALGHGGKACASSSPPRRSRIGCLP